MNVLDINRIRVDLELSSKEDVFKAISEIALKEGIVKSSKEYLNGLREREEECTTGFGKGFAIPHCKSKTVNYAGVIVIRLKNPIEWDSMDGKPVKFILALAVPDSEAGTTHLKILSQIARCLMDDDFITGFKNLKNEEAIYNYLKEKIGGI